MTGASDASLAEADRTASGSEGLRGAIRAPGIVFLVIAASAPLTAVAGALPVAIGSGNGPGIPAAYLVATAVLLVFSVGFTGMSRYVVSAGAFYAYIGKGLGPSAGLGAAGVALLAYSAIQAAIYGLVGATLADAVAAYGGPALPWWLYSGVLVAAVGVLGYRSIELGAKVLGVMLVLETAIIAVLDAAVLIQGGAQGISVVSFTLEAFFTGAPGIGLMFAVASFIGFEATAIYGEEARDPKRTVPIATYAAVVLIGGLYTVSSWAVVLAFGPGQVAAAATADPSGLVLTATGTYLGPLAVDLMQLLLITSLFAALLAFHNAIARYLFALGRQGVGPAVLARAHSEHGSPHVGSAMQTGSAVLIVGVFAVAAADPVLQMFSWMSGVATLSVLLLMTLTSVAIFAFFGHSRVDQRWWHARIAPALGTAGLLFMTLLVLVNFPVLIGGSVTLAVAFISVIAAAFIAGFGIARYWRTRKPDRYSLLRT
ncbi:APC family permease [Haloactinomyces albus]|uniref:Amino acid transporter n=1 Tax=Haloactinomyces albus TaxID=1352928 RepID=A0AAE3ZI99_9ACTN|nr:APC family permease [Haloactinomyces albus]MDR7304088.1 amino acid transporter [Haloactinomyces albus]